MVDIERFRKWAGAPDCRLPIQPSRSVTSKKILLEVVRFFASSESCPEVPKERVVKFLESCGLKSRSIAVNHLPYMASPGVEIIERFTKDSKILRLTQKFLEIGSNGNLEQPNDSDSGRETEESAEENAAVEMVTGQDKYLFLADPKIREKLLALWEYIFSRSNATGKWDERSISINPPLFEENEQSFLALRNGGIESSAEIVSLLRMLGKMRVVSITPINSKGYLSVVIYPTLAEVVFSELSESQVVEGEISEEEKECMEKSALSDLIRVTIKAKQAKALAKAMEKKSQEVIEMMDTLIEKAKELIGDIEPAEG